jgi:TetR/AcrR family transcriptional regulator, tetracycline repressor protein
VSRPGPDENREQRRAEIVQAGLAVLEKEGFERMSLRAVAREMGMHAPGLYWYIESKQELIDLMAKAILDDGMHALRGPAEGEQWQDWLTELAVQMRRCLVARRDGARVVAGAYLFGTDALTAVLEMALTTLEAAGFPRRRAMLGVITVMRYTMGIALDEQASPPHPPPMALEGGAPPHGGPPIDAARWPRVAAAFGEYFAELPDRSDRAEPHFLRGIELIIGGMEFHAARG